MKTECEGCDNLECQVCCEHDDIEDGFCLCCGADRTEHLMSKAYDYYKNRRYE